MHSVTDRLITVYANSVQYDRLKGVTHMNLCVVLENICYLLKFVMFQLSVLQLQDA